MSEMTDRLLKSMLSTEMRENTKELMTKYEAGKKTYFDRKYVFFQVHGQKVQEETDYLVRKNKRRFNGKRGWENGEEAMSAIRSAIEADSVGLIFISLSLGMLSGEGTFKHDTKSLSPEQISTLYNDDDFREAVVAKATELSEDEELVEFLRVNFASAAYSTGEKFGLCAHASGNTNLAWDAHAVALRSSCIGFYVLGEVLGSENAEIALLNELFNQTI